MEKQIKSKNIKEASIYYIIQDTVCPKKTEHFKFMYSYMIKV